MPFVYTKISIKFYFPYGAVLTMSRLLCWLFGAFLGCKSWPIQNLISLDSFQNPRECCLLSDLYEQFLALSVCVDTEVLEQCLQLSQNAFPNLEVLLLFYL
jgi:hypothetical protein